MERELNTEILEHLVKVLLPASMIPIGSRVTKPTGTKGYILKDEVRIYHAPDGLPSSLKSEGILFITDGTSFNAIRDDAILGWVLTGEELFHHLNDCREELDGQ